MRMRGLAAGKRKVLPLTALVALFLAVGAAPAAPANDWTFVQVQRVNALSLQPGTDSFATHNAFGGAFVGSAAKTNIQSNIDSSVADGSVSWLLEMPGLTDLSGANNPSFNLGVLGATPVTPAGNPATYNGSSDLDWWYLPDPSDVQPDGSATHQLSATFSASTLSAGPGSVQLVLNFIGAVLTLDMSNVQLQAATDASSAPLRSTNGFPPGHQPGENLPDSLTSFASMSAGKLIGRISAESLYNTLVPSALTGSTCGNLYTSTNTILDLLVSGCKSGGVISQVTPTQPDTYDPALGSGSYAFTVGANHAVTGCTHNGVAATLSDCLQQAAYSVYFQFATDRVIDRNQVTVGKLLSLTKAGSGAGSVVSSPTGIDCGSDCAEGFTSGTPVTLSATPSSGSRFAGWTGCDNPSGTTCGMTMNGDKTVTVSFVRQAPLTVTRDGSGAGSVTSSPSGIDCGADCSEIYDSGTQVTLTATPSSGSVFAGWTGGGCSGTGQCVTTVDDATAVTATFASAAGTSADAASGGSGGVGATPIAGTQTPADTTAPVFTSATIAPRKVVKRATVRYELSEAAQVTFVFEAAAPGRRAGGKCVKPTRANVRQRHCVRFLAVARLTSAARAGQNQQPFTTHTGGRTLKPGTYRLTLQAADAAGNKSQPRQLTFVVARA